MNEKDFEKEFVELFAFEIGQEFAKASPKDTTLLSKSFPGTAENIKIEGNSITWFNVPYYWEYVEYGHFLRNGKFLAPNPFVRRTLEKESEKIAERVIRILSKR